MLFTVSASALRQGPSRTRRPTGLMGAGPASAAHTPPVAPPRRALVRRWLGGSAALLRGEASSLSYGRLRPVRRRISLLPRFRIANEKEMNSSSLNEFVHSLKCCGFGKPQTFPLLTPKAPLPPWVEQPQSWAWPGGARERSGCWAARSRRARVGSLRGRAQNAFP